MGFNSRLLALRSLHASVLKKVNKINHGFLFQVNGPYHLEYGAFTTPRPIHLNSKVTYMYCQEDAQKGPYK